VKSEEWFYVMSWSRPDGPGRTAYSHRVGVITMSRSATAWDRWAAASEHAGLPNDAVLTSYHCEPTAR
jgi:hypothetical protein